MVQSYTASNIVPIFTGICSSVIYLYTLTSSKLYIYSILLYGPFRFGFLIPCYLFTLICKFFRALVSAIIAHTHKDTGSPIMPCAWLTKLPLYNIWFALSNTMFTHYMRLFIIIHELSWITSQVLSTLLQRLCILYLFQPSFVNKGRTLFYTLRTGDIIHHLTSTLFMHLNGSGHYPDMKDNI